MADESVTLEAVKTTLEAEGIEVIANAVIQQVTCQDELTVALEKKKFLKDFIAKATDKLEPLRIATYDAYQEVLALRSEIVKPAQTELDKINSLANKYLVEEETRRREEQKRLQAQAEKEAREKAEAERKRLATEHAKQQKKEAEARAKAEEEAKRLRAEGQRKAAAELKARQEREAEEAKQRREREMAEQAERARQQPAPVAVAPAPVLPKGVTIAKHWTYEVVNELEVPIMYKQLNHELIRRTVTAQGSVCQIPGIRVYQAVTTPTRTK